MLKTRAKIQYDVLLNTPEGALPKSFLKTANGLYSKLYWQDADGEKHYVINTVQKNVAGNDWEEDIDIKVSRKKSRWTCILICWGNV